MLKIIMGIDSPDAGQVQYAKDCQVGYLEQETNLEQKDTTILAEVMAAAKEIRRMGKRANELQAQITELSEQGKDVDALLNEYGQVQDRFEHLGGYELESNARKILSGLGFKVTDLSAVLRVLGRLADAHRAGKALPAPSRPAAARRAHQPLGPRKRPVAARLYR